MHRQIVASFGDVLEPNRVVTKSRTRAAKQSEREFLKAASQYSLETETGRRRYRKHVRAIERVSITNIRAVKRLDIDLTATGSGHNRWLTLLGENGTGKSTVLQCIVLALVGSEYFLDLASRQGFTPSDFIRRRCRSGTIEVKICLLYTSPSPRGATLSRMPSSA